VTKRLKFLVLELGLGPLQALALIGYSYKLLRFNIPKGISGTAYEPLFRRLLMHQATTREDEASMRLAPHLPALSAPIAWMLGSLGLASRWSGHLGAAVAYPPSRPSTMSSWVAHRTEFFDGLLAKATRRDGSHPVRQVVILGAGWDCRSYGLLADTQARLFEVDTVPTQRAKRAALDRAGLSADHVTFVETDFNQKSWFQAISEQGFDPALPTFVLWEGVTMYLDDEAVDATLRQVAQLAPGSRIAFDYLSRELVRAEAPFAMLGKAVQSGTKFYGEPFRFGISTAHPAREQIDQLVTAAGLGLSDYEPMGSEDKLHGGLAMAICAG